MMAYEAKTIATNQSVADFILRVEPARRQVDSKILLSMLQTITGKEPVMWGASIIGYGRYDYQYQSGHSGSFFRVGFSPRKASLVIYIMPGYQNFEEILSRLGKHKTGKSCLYINKLADINLDVLEELVRAGLKVMDERYPPGD